MLPSFATETVVLVSPAYVKDSRNNRVPDFTAAGGAVRVPVSGCSVQPGATAEVLAGRDSTAVRYTVLAPPWVDASSSQGVEYRGKVYGIDGEPQRWPSPTGALDHVVLLLIDWK